MAEYKIKFSNGTEEPTSIEFKYPQETWVNDETALSADNLNRIEDRISETQLHLSSIKNSQVSRDDLLQLNYEVEKHSGSFEKLKSDISKVDDRITNVSTNQNNKNNEIDTNINLLNNKFDDYYKKSETYESTVIDKLIDKSVGDHNKSEESHTDIRNKLELASWQIGDIRTTVKNNLPDPWLQCDGSTIDPDIYPGLSALLSVNDQTGSGGYIKEDLYAWDSAEKLNKSRIEEINKIVCLNHKLFIINSDSLYYRPQYNDLEWIKVNTPPDFVISTIEYGENMYVLGGYSTKTGPNISSSINPAIAYCDNLNCNSEDWNVVVILSDTRTKSNGSINHLHYGGGFWTTCFRYYDYTSSTSYYPKAYFGYTDTITNTQWNLIQVEYDIGTGGDVTYYTDDNGVGHWLAIHKDLEGTDYTYITPFTKSSDGTLKRGSSSSYKGSPSLKFIETSKYPKLIWNNTICESTTPSDIDSWTPIISVDEGIISFINDWTQSNNLTGKYENFYVTSNGSVYITKSEDNTTLPILRIPPTSDTSEIIKAVDYIGDTYIIYTHVGTVWTAKNLSGYTKLPILTHSNMFYYIKAK